MPGNADAFAQEFLRTGHDIARAQHAADGAQMTADGAVASISEHEVLCATRYATINTQLGQIPQLFAMLGKVQVLVYIGVGIWIGAPVIAGAIFGIIKLTGH